MSIIERYSPLNLAYKVIIVTNASSPTGVIVCNTLLKSNALVLGTDNKPKDESLAESKYTHFQFHKCELINASAVSNIIADAKQKFKVDRVDGLVNLASLDDDPKTRDAQKDLALTCAKIMEAADGGAIVNTVLQASMPDFEIDLQVIDQLTGATKEIISKSSSHKVRCNTIASGDKENLKACKQYEEAKEHLGFLFKPPTNPNAKASGKIASKETQATFEFSNTVLFLISGMSESLNGAVLNPQGQLVQT